MPIRVNQFKGRVPRLEPTNLSPEYATVADNCKLITGGLDAWREPLPVMQTQAGLRTIYKYGAQWLCWSAGNVSVAPSLNPNDGTDRVYWSDGGRPKQSNRARLAFGGAGFLVNPDASRSYPLGVPAPDNPPQVAFAGAAPALYDETRTYVYAWVHGRTIGARSATFTGSVNENGTVYVAGLDDTPPSSYGGQPADAKDFQKWLFLVDAAASQYVLIAKLTFDDSDYQDDGGTLQRRYRDSAFKPSKIAAPGGTPTAGPLNQATGARSTRVYVYCWTWNLNGAWYRSEASAEASLAGVAEGDSVVVSDMAPEPLATIPAGAKQIRKSVFRRDGGGTLRLVSHTQRRQPMYLDAKRTSRLGKLLTAFTLGLSGAPTAPTLTLATSDTTSEASVVTRFYFSTLVSVTGAEGPPSGSSAEINPHEWQDVSVTTATAAPAGYESAVVSKRIYRTDRNGLIRLVMADVPLAQATVVDNVPDDGLGDELATQTYYPPPDGLLGLCTAPWGGLAGFVGNQLCFSKPGLADAWAPDDRLTTEYPITGIAFTQAGLQVATTGIPYMVVGTQPGALDRSRVDEQQACVSTPGVVDMGAFAVYPSPDGLVAVDGGQAKVITAEVCHRDAWQAQFNPTTIRGAYYEGRYFGFYERSGTTVGFMFDVADPAMGFVDFPGTAATALFNDRTEDALYLQVGAWIVRWDAGAAKLPFVWRSKLFVSDVAMTPAVAMCVAAGYPVTLTLIGDAVTRFATPMGSNRPFRLAGGYRARQFQVALSGTVGPVWQFAIGSSMEDVQVDAA